MRVQNIQNAEGSTSPPPPPYATQDPHPDAGPTSSEAARPSLRGGELNPPASLSTGDEKSRLAYLDFFEARAFDARRQRTPLASIEYGLFFDENTTPTRLPFPNPPDQFLSRDVTGQDWAKFVDSLFPVLRETSTGRPKSRSKSNEGGVTASPERKERTAKVVADWNHGFFGPRNIRIITNVDFEPASSGTLQDERGLRDIPSTYSSTYSVPTYPDASNEALPSGPGGRLSSYKEKLRRLKSNESISSTSSSSSSSSDSSISSIGSKDLKHATVPEINELISNFRQDLSLNSKANLHQSVQNLRNGLLSRHMAFSSGDRSKVDKKAFKDERKAAKSEIKAIVKSAKHDRKSQWKQEHHARKNERKAQRQAAKSERKMVKDEIKAMKGEARSERRQMRRGRHSPPHSHSHHHHHHDRPRNSHHAHPPHMGSLQLGPLNLGPLNLGPPHTPNHQQQPYYPPQQAEQQQQYQRGFPSGQQSGVVPASTPVPDPVDLPPSSSTKA